MSPSDVAEPLATRRKFAPLIAVGIGVVFSSTPAAEYWSRKTAVAALESAALPSPTR